MYWLALLSQEETELMIKSGLADRLRPLRSFGLVVAQEQAGSEAMTRALGLSVLGHSQLVILGDRARLAFLLLAHAYREDR